ncbi:structure-specific endonuclease subunit SLX4 [Sceloporus undulatus]|uniref:structure-specific endonuclease subunit SLX4 n=1 Tax=Sceloporus undulatus TaxID=8520 RepID=UPI001C4C8BBD|nr:structure-specific endonuclease subunit SLX4 [Sceloporus undulatus]
MGDSGDEFRQQRRGEARRGAEAKGGGAGSRRRRRRGGALGPVRAPLSAPERGVQCQLCREDLSALDPLRRELHVNGCLDRMERPPGPPPASKEEKEEEEEGPRRGRKRSSGASPAEPLAKKKRRAPRALDEELLLALAMSRSLREEEEAQARRLRGQRGPGAEKRRRLRAPRSPPPLLLQDPEKARRETEARAEAMLLQLLPDAEELPSTPPLPASRLLEAPRGFPGSLWAFSSLTEEALPGSRGDLGFSLLPPPEQGALFLRPGPAGLPGLGCLAPEPGSSQAPQPSSQSREVLGSQHSAEGALQDLVELAGEGLTLTQWNQDVQWLEGPRQEQAVLRSAPQKAPVRLQEEEKEERESSGSSHPAVGAVLREVSSPQLSSLATAFGMMVNNPHLSDVQFQVDSGEILYAHLFVLYVRCPQLLEVIDRTAFMVAEEGGTGTLRMLLSNVPAEAVSAFLKYLYAADLCVPHHLQSDVGCLAARFGLHDLAALCGSRLSFKVSGGREDGDGVRGCDGTEDIAETFEELLESMWQDEDEEAVVNCVHQEGNSSATVGEEELEEIYEFAATQRGSAARAQREEEEGEEEEKKGCSKGKECQGGRWEGPHFTSSKEGLGDPAMNPVTTPGAAPPALPCSPDAGQGGGPQQLPLVLQEGAGDRRKGRLQQSLRAPAEVSAQGSLAEGQRCSLQPKGVGSRGSVGNPLQTVQKVFPWDSPCEPIVPTLLPRELVLSPSPSCGIGSTRSRLPHAPHLSAFLPGRTGMGCSSFSSQTALEAPCGGPGEPLLGAKPLPGSPGGGPVVVLDSDEEWESGACVGGPLLRFGSSSGKSQELLRLSSSNEEDSGEGGEMLAPDTPLPSRPTVGSLPNTGASLMPGHKGQQWIGESRGGSSPERPSLRDQLPLACEPLPLLLPTPLPGSSPSWDDVVIVDDSKEDQEEEGTPVWQHAARTAEAGNANSQPGSPSGPMDSEDGSPLAGGGCGPSSEGAADDSDGSESLPLTQRSPSSPAVPTQATPDPAGQLERLLPVTPLTPMPSYSVMATPVLKKELKRFGVRALPKRQMVLKLKEIFQFTHQRRDGKSKGRAAAAPLAPLPCPAGTIWESQQMVGSRDLCGESAQEAELHGFPGGSEQRKWRTALPAAGFTLGSNAGSGGCLPSPPASQESTSSSVASSETSVLSHSSPLSEFETSVLEEEEEALAPADKDEGKLEAFRHYIRSTPSLCRQILLYQPIELAVLQATLRQSGIKIALGKLLDFLDAHCITFTTAEARREKLRHSQPGKKRRGQRHRR